MAKTMTNSKQTSYRIIPGMCMKTRSIYKKLIIVITYWAESWTEQQVNRRE